ncbi:unnamed protein product [Somion occarium]|uniref:VTT domain-containing protein n=1 Tax=Somion occarium TaxID=3059160 RepID=A0ABP1CW75_9APHY
MCRLQNVLAGALFSPAYATLLLTALTTVGSVFASLLSAPLAPFLSSVFPRVLTMTRNAIEGNSDSEITDATSVAKSSPRVRLSILRLIGIIPWSGINIACGVCGISVMDCVKGTFIGALPWTAVTCQIGDILQSVASNPSPTPKSVQSLLTSPDIIMKLVFLTCLSLAPILGCNYLHQWISSSVEGGPISQAETGDEKASRWAWVKEWRAFVQQCDNCGERYLSHLPVQAGQPQAAMEPFVPQTNTQSYAMNSPPAMNSSNSQSNPFIQPEAEPYVSASAEGPSQRQGSGRRQRGGRNNTVGVTSAGPGVGFANAEASSSASVPQGSGGSASGSRPGPSTIPVASPPMRGNSSRERRPGGEVQVHGHKLSLSLHIVVLPTNFDSDTDQDEAAPSMGIQVPDRLHERLLKVTVQNLETAGFVRHTTLTADDKEEWIGDQIENAVSTLCNSGELFFPSFSALDTSTTSVTFNSVEERQHWIIFERFPFQLVHPGNGGAKATKVGRKLAVEHNDGFWSYTFGEIQKLAKKLGGKFQKDSGILLLVPKNGVMIKKVNGRSHTCFAELAARFVLLESDRPNPLPVCEAATCIGFQPPPDSAAGPNLDQNDDEDNVQPHRPARIRFAENLPGDSPPISAPNTSSTANRSLPPSTPSPNLSPFHDFSVLSPSEVFDGGSDMGEPSNLASNQLGLSFGPEEQANAADMVERQGPTHEHRLPPQAILTPTLSMAIRPYVPSVEIPHQTLTAFIEYIQTTPSVLADDPRPTTIHFRANSPIALQDMFINFIRHCLKDRAERDPDIKAYALSSPYLPTARVEMFPKDIHIGAMLHCKQWITRNGSSGDAIGEAILRETYYNILQRMCGDEFGLTTGDYADEYQIIKHPTFSGDSFLKDMEALGAVAASNMVAIHMACHPLSPVLLEAAVNGINSVLDDDPWLHHVSPDTMAPFAHLPQVPGPLAIRPDSPHYATLCALVQQCTSMTGLGSISQMNADAYKSFVRTLKSTALLGVAPQEFDNSSATVAFRRGMDLYISSLVPLFVGAFQPSSKAILAGLYPQHISKVSDVVDRLQFIVQESLEEEDPTVIDVCIPQLSAAIVHYLHGVGHVNHPMFNGEGSILTPDAYRAEKHNGLYRAQHFVKVLTGHVLLPPNGEMLKMRRIDCSFHRVVIMSIRLQLMDINRFHVKLRKYVLGDIET